jgi:hypothetical protein
MRQESLSTYMPHVTSIPRSLGRKVLTVIFAAGLLSVASSGFCQEPVAMAPPVETDASGPAGNVFNYQEIPQNQNVPIQRAVFDRGGYQLYDTAGETIVVPFRNNNLYVMKFAVSPDGSTYFVNDDNVPVLYLPQDGYLANGSDPGGRWHPFTTRWHPYAAVYLGIAPSWHDYIGMGWYPNMAYYGGYWSNRPFISVGAFFPSLGLFINIGGSSYAGWGPYSNYYGYHPAPYREEIVNQNYYNYGGSNWRQYATANHPFNGTGRSYVYGHGFVASAGRAAIAGRTVAAVPAQRTFRGTGRPYVIGHGYAATKPTATAARAQTALAHQKFSGRTAADNNAIRASARTFHGAAPTRAVSHASTNSRAVAANHTFRGATAARSIHTAQRSYSGPTHNSFRGATSTHAARNSGGSQGHSTVSSFRGGSASRPASGGSHSSGVGSSHSSQGGRGGSDNRSQNGH